MLCLNFSKQSVFHCCDEIKKNISSALYGVQSLENSRPSHLWLSIRDLTGFGSSVGGGRYHRSLLTPRMWRQLTAHGEDVFSDELPVLL